MQTSFTQLGCKGKVIMDVFRIKTLKLIVNSNFHTSNGLQKVEFTLQRLLHDTSIMERRPRLWVEAARSP